MRTIEVSLESIRLAMERAHDRSDDWQAELCEIALIPVIAKRWQELNPNFQGLHLERVPGLPHILKTPDDNRAIGDAKRWAEYAGYVLVLFGEGENRYTWNAVRPDWYGHSPSTAWNGMRRETVSQFIETLRMVACGNEHDEYTKNLARAGIMLAGQAAVA
jgi:hypothetical protein